MSLLLCVPARNVYILNVFYIKICLFLVRKFLSEINSIYRLHTLWCLTNIFFNTFFIFFWYNWAEYCPVILRSLLHNGRAWWTQCKCMQNIFCVSKTRGLTNVTNIFNWIDLSKNVEIIEWTQSDIFFFRVCNYVIAAMQ